MRHFWLFLLVLGLVACGAPSTTSSVPTTASVSPTLAPTVPPPTTLAAMTVAPPSAAPQATALPRTAPTETPMPSPVEFVGVLIGDPNPFLHPGSVKVDSHDNLYVVDSGNSRIQVFDPNGKFMRMWGTPGAGPGEFNLHYRQWDAGDVAIDAQGNVYVADSGNNRVQKFDPSGKLLTQWGSQGTGDGQLVLPLAVGVDSQGSVYVLGGEDADVIKKYDPNGRFLLKFGGFGANYLAIDRRDTLFVGDTDNRRVDLFDRNGVLLSQWGKAGNGAGEFVNVTGITVDQAGHVFVSGADSDNPATWQVQMFDRGGQYLGVWGHPGSGEGEFRLPFSLAADSRGYIYVGDYGNNRVQKFRVK